MNIYGSISNLGYGIHCQNIVKALIEEGQQVNLTLFGQVQQDSFFEMYNKRALDNKYNFNFNDPSIFIFHDELSNQASGTPLIVFSIFETTKPKDISIKMLNNGPAKMIAVTSQEHKDILSRFTEKPIVIIPEGVDSSLYNTIQFDPYVKTNKFTFLTVGKVEERKNTGMILKAFVENFKDKTCALIAHTFNPFVNQTKDHPFQNLSCWSTINPLKYGFEYKGFYNKYHLFSYKDCDLYFTTPTIPVSNMPSLYHSADIGIQVSRGEAYDLPCAEMLGCGLPVIATDCIGHTIYLKDAPEEQKKLIVPITEYEPANDGMWFKGDQGEWGKVDPVKLTEKMIQVFDNKDSYINKSESIATYIEQNHSWSKAAKILLEISKT